MVRSLVLVLSLLVLAACPGGEEKPGRPNVLLLVMDTARADRTTLNGYGRPTTPHLERLAEESVVFTDAWSSSPWTGPSHATIFTGLRPENHGFVYGNRVFLVEEADTIAERLRASGYATACLTNNTTVSEQFGLIQGFDEYQSVESIPDPGPVTARWAHERGLEWAEEQRAAGRPFFLFINDFEPHLAYAPPEEVAARFVRAGTPAERVRAARAVTGREAMAHNLGVARIAEDLWPVLSDLYDAEIATLDSEIGWLINGLRSKGILDETLVIVTSDHGENLGNHGRAGHHFCVHRTLLNVPLLIRFPGLFDGGAVVRDTVRTEDLYPTILNVCGLSVPDGLDGRPLGGDLSGRVARAIWGRAPVEKFRDQGFPTADVSAVAFSVRSVHDGRHHLIVRSDGLVRLYDVVADPLEEDDLTEEEPETVTRLRGLLGK